MGCWESCGKFMRETKFDRHRLELVKTFGCGYLKRFRNAKKQNLLRESNQGGLPSLLLIHVFFI